jgi:esterase/lipase superfamily enzyme
MEATITRVPMALRKRILTLIATCVAFLAMPLIAQAEYKIVYKGTSNRVIIFVHGSIGDPLTTFGVAGGPSWPDLMHTDTEGLLDQPALSTYTTATLGVPETGQGRLSLTEVARQFEAELRENGVLDGTKEIVFIAHGHGGVIVQELLGNSVATNKIRRIRATFVEGNGYYTQTNLTFELCERRCLADNRCKMFELYAPDGTCNLYAHTRTASPSSNSEVGLKSDQAVLDNVGRSTKAVFLISKTTDPRFVSAGRPIFDAAASRDYSAQYAPESHWLLYLQKPLIDRGKVFCAFETINIGQRAPLSQYIFDKCDEAPTAISGDHLSVVKPTSKEAQEFQWVRMKLAASIVERAAAREQALREATEVLREQPPERAATAQCVRQRTCSLVRIFFGTDRQRITRTLPSIDFGPERHKDLQLGRALVTVPRVVERRTGEILRPTWWDRAINGVPAAGDPVRHFTILPGGTVIFDGDEEYLMAVREHMKDAGDFKDHAFVFVHGYNTSFEDALYRVAQIAFDLAGPDGKPFGTPFLYSWPSGGRLRDYAYDAESAQFSVDHLQEFLEIVVRRTGAKHVHLIAHSMGNRPLLKALEGFTQQSPRPKNISQIILAAPDIDAIQFAKIAKLIAPLSKGVTLYASSNDVAMKASRDVHRGQARAGDVPALGPIIVKGIDTIDVSAISTDIIATGHSEYAERRELLNDIALLLRKGERPPHQRMPMMKPVDAETGRFWRIH